MGKKIVIATWGSFGDLHPYMALALDLQRRGHRVTIATLPIYRDKVGTERLGFHPVRPDLPSPEESVDLIRRAVDSIEGPAYIFSKLITPHLRDTYSDTLAAVQADGGADLLISHPTTLTAPLIAEKTAIRWVSTVLAPISFLSYHDPPTPPQFPALRSLLCVHPIVAAAVGGLAKRMTLGWVRPVKSLRSELGLPPGAHPIFEGQHSPRLVLALYSDLLGKIQPDFPANTRVTGFVFYDSDRPGLDPELETFLRDCEEAGEAPVLFTLGSSAVWIADDFFQVSIEAVRGLRRRALLIIADRSQLPPGPLPPGVRAFKYAPYHRVMPRSSAIVHQGGIGTTAQALRAGRPTLIMPFGHDTHDNARRVAELGVGRTLTRKRYRVENVKKALRDLFEDPSYQERAAWIGERIRRENGLGAACDAIEGAMRSPMPDAPRSG